MSNEAFYLKDEKHFNVKENKEVILKDQLYFKSEVKSHVPEVKGDLHDDRATQQNTITYQKAWDNFRAANGGYKTAWGEEIPVAAPAAAPAPVIEEEIPTQEIPADEKAPEFLRSSKMV